MTTFNSGFGHGFEYAYFIGIYVAPLLMGVALWRSRAVPRWLAVLFFAAVFVNGKLVERPGEDASPEAA